MPDFEVVDSEVVEGGESERGIEPYLLTLRSA
jgi:hypothetical protein